MVSRLGNSVPAQPASENSKAPTRICRRRPKRSATIPAKGAKNATSSEGAVTSSRVISSALGLSGKLACSPGSAGLMIVLDRMVSDAASNNATARGSLKNASMEISGNLDLGAS